MVVSFLHGRIRLRLKELKNSMIAESVLAQIKGVPGIITAEVNPATGSLLIEYDTKVLPTEKLIKTGRQELAKLNVLNHTLKIPAIYSAIPSAVCTGEE